MDKNEAIKIIRSNFPTGRKILCEALEILIPELKENENEKIRKVLKSFFDSEMSDYGNVEWRNGIKYGEIVAWLEKQDEKAKLSEEEQNRVAKGVLSSCAMSFIDYLDAHKYKGKMCVSNGECEDIENAFHNAMWDRLHRYYCKYIEKQGEQKPTWSEEDEDALDIAVRIIQNGGDDCAGILDSNKVLDWLKSLKERMKGE